MQQFFPLHKSLDKKGVAALLQLLPYLLLAQNFPIDIVVPNGLLNVEGNDGSRLPFAEFGTVRYQQIYEASQFSALPPGGAFLSRIFLRNDCHNPVDVVVTNLQVNVSMTTKGPDTLGAT